MGFEIHQLWFWFGKFYLQSLPITSQNCAKFSRKQEVSVTPQNNFNSVWIMEYYDPKVRFEFNGQPVQVRVCVLMMAVKDFKVNETVLLKHSFTAQWLASDEISYRSFSRCSWSWPLLETIWGMSSRSSGIRSSGTTRHRISSPRKQGGQPSMSPWETSTTRTFGWSGLPGHRRRSSMRIYW